ncbi:MAG: hypothetical protein ACI4JM_07400 [Oscillospiraceae bacterium]
MNIKDNLREYIDAGYPMLYINAYEEIKADTLIEKYSDGKHLVLRNSSIFARIVFLWYNNLITR